MPEFVPIPNTAQVDVRGLLWGQQVQNTLYFSHIGGVITDEDLDELALFVAGRWTDYFQPWLCHAYTFIEVYAVDLTSPTGPSSTASTGGGWTGEYPTDSQSMPGALTLCIAFRTNGRGKSQRGRNFWPGLPRNIVSGNQVTVTYASTAASKYNVLLPGGAAPIPGWQWVIASRVSNGAPRPVGVIIPVIEATFVDLNVDCQRRRLHGRGN